MKQNEVFHLVKNSKVSDGMGGFINVADAIVQTFKGFKAPINMELIINNYGVANKYSYQIVTKDKLINSFEFIKHNDKKYKALSVQEHSGLTVILLEEI